MTDGVATMAAPLARPAYKRVLLKISGEALMGPGQFGLHPPTVERIAGEVEALHRLGVEIAMVIGGGNIFRGLQGSRAGDGAHDRRLHGHARDGDERPRDAVGARDAAASIPGSSRRSRWTRSASPTSAAARCATSRRAAW